MMSQECGGGDTMTVSRRSPVKQVDALCHSKGLQNQMNCLSLSIRPVQSVRQATAERGDA